MLQNYKEYRGPVVRKYRSFWGKYIIVIKDESGEGKVEVNQAMFDYLKIDSIWTIGAWDKKLVNIQPGYAETDA